MYELKVSVKKVMGTCTATIPLKRGDYFTVRDGDIRIPEGSNVCIWALQNLLPLLPAKEREIQEEKNEDWMWRVHHAQCPDPDGRVIFKIDQTGKLGEEEKEEERRGEPAEPVEALENTPPAPGIPHDLRVVVDQVKGRCTSGMQPGDYFLLRSSLLIIPPDRHFCLYALQAVLPFLAAKQRHLQDEDWLKDAQYFLCPDPAGNVILRIERIPISDQVEP